MIVDCFSFWDELDLLEIRLAQHDFVDMFILSEAASTTRGNPKPFFFEQNKSRFDKHLKRIKHVTIDRFPAPDTPWHCANFQRDLMARALPPLQSEDVVLNLDVDEITTAEAVETFRGLDCTVATPQMLCFSYYANWFTGCLWENGRFQRGCLPLRISPTYQPNGHNPDHPYPTLSEIRQKRDDEVPRIANAGWHFGNFLGGDPQRLLTKIKNIPHLEDDTPEICGRALQMIEERRSHLHPGEPYEVWNIDDRFPAFMRNHAGPLTERGVFRFSNSR